MLSRVMEPVVLEVGDLVWLQRKEVLCDPSSQDHARRTRASQLRSDHHRLLPSRRRTFLPVLSPLSRSVRSGTHPRVSGRAVLKVSATFYRDVLGFAVHAISDPGWLFYTSGDCTIMAGECPDAIPPRKLGDHSYFAYLQVDEIDSFYASLLAAGAEIGKAIRDEPWGMREFGLVTIDGHRIMFGAPKLS
jgi:catechol 2,3-dioxygenase-like lactoylglutathione lyase family enzyme